MISGWWVDEIRSQSTLLKDCYGGRVENLDVSRVWIRGGVLGQIHPGMREDEVSVALVCK